MGNSYVIRYKSKDIEIEVQGDRQFVERKFDELLQKFIAPLPVKKEEIMESFSEKIDRPSEGIEVKELKEFMKKFYTDYHPQRILLVARFLKEKAGKKSFSIFDIRHIYKLMRWSITRNPAAFLLKLRKKKYLATIPKKTGRHLYIITEKGIKKTEEFRK
jgi:hypothetical protein